MPTDISSQFVAISAPKLTPRLAEIHRQLVDNQAQQQYHSVWDCCCDHGYLGFNLVASALFQRCYFVDQIPHITEELLTVLQRHGGDSYRVITADVGELHFDGSIKHCVIIAGVGGRAIIEMLQGIQKNNAAAELDFILCATNYVYDLRRYLGQQRMSLVEEVIVEDRGRQYECLYLRGTPVAGASIISPVGAMWQADNAMHRRYQAKLLKHYRQQQRSQDSESLRQTIVYYQHCFGADWNEVTT
ncbi:hypothetical protein SIN8267_00148 [Sinobacterium norvegicum]|uniref:SAM-dependent methyltransferase n=1 Tax=Sinobacterium norvegicum TaxID=1641715 RepID=A0ABN8EC42_9GAMM|nr:tRNA (adenine(22)-N(1))-methyltransferase TrmK [Sinobacterium norvegicum]CAH0990065.1 hypothetical protein SIN8267_00148 [Sinobacterium norvegicum]